MRGEGKESGERRDRGGRGGQEKRGRGEGGWMGVEMGMGRDKYSSAYLDTG